jgi:hypothetical protein
MSQADAEIRTLKCVSHISSAKLSAKPSAKPLNRIGEDFDLPSDWLNDAAKGYAHGLTPGPMLLDTTTLRVRAVSIEQLLAMKLSAWRDDLDVQDARRLLQECGEAREEVWQRFSPYFELLSEWVPLL